MRENTLGNISLLLVLILPIAIALPFLATGVAEVLSARSERITEIDILLSEAASYLPDRQLAKNHLLTKVSFLEASSLYESSYSLELSNSKIHFSLNAPISLAAGERVSNKQNLLAVSSARRVSPIETILFLPQSFSEELIESWQKSIGHNDVDKRKRSCHSSLLLFVKQFAIAVSALRSQILGDELRLLRYAYGESKSSVLQLEESSCAFETIQILKTMPVRDYSWRSNSCVEQVVKDSRSLQRKVRLSLACTEPSGVWNLLWSSLSLLSFEINSNVQFAKEDLLILEQLASLGFDSAAAREDPSWRREVVIVTEAELSLSSLREIDFWARKNFTSFHVLSFKSMRFSEVSDFRELAAIQDTYSELVTLYQISSPDDLARVADELLSLRSTELLF